MAELKNWLTELKTEKPELDNFITRLEVFISDTGLNVSDFEKAVEIGLQMKEDQIRELFKNK